MAASTTTLNVAHSGISVLSEAEKLGIIGIILAVAVLMGVFGFLMWREERKCRTKMFAEVSKCRDEITALLKADVSHARISKS